VRRRAWRRLGRNLTRWTSIGYFRSLKRRIGALETVVDTLIASPVYVPDPATAFNGQAGRQRLFEEIASRMRFDGIVETGTFLGNTAGWMNHVTQLPVYSSEINRHFHLLARKRLAERAEVRLELGESIDLLRGLAATPLRGQRVFFYLDAHWHERLPLADELRTISAHWRDFVVMVDDFEVPWDEGYGFDDYGFGRSLTLGCFGRLFRELGLMAYFPTLAAEEETGARSGCVVLARRGSETASRLDEISLLRSIAMDRARA
jgi:hypothetical protein